MKIHPIIPFGEYVHILLALQVSWKCRCKTTSGSKVGFCYSLWGFCLLVLICYVVLCTCYDIKPVRMKEGKSYWKIPLGDDDATREK